MTEKTPIAKPATAEEIRARHEINGARRANTNLIMYALDQLKPGDERTNAEKLAAMTVEREHAIAALRHFAVISGLSDWPENLSLPEIIDKYIAAPISVLLVKEKAKR